MKVGLKIVSKYWDVEINRTLMPGSIIIVGEDRAKELLKTPYVNIIFIRNE